MTIRSRAGLTLSLMISIVFLLTACGGGDDEVTTPPAGTSAELTVQVQADFGAGKVGDELKTLLTGGCPVPAPATDQPDFPAGEDCDEDGGVITFNTPSGFKVAIRELQAIREDGSRLDLIPDTGTLSASEVADLAQTVTLFTANTPAARYTAIEAVFYYYELTMTMNDPATVENVRIYLSDDDFAAEGQGGHHQGDITLVGNDGVEAGWAAGCATWDAAGALASRDGLVGAGGMDPETGHARGLYGDTNLWNQSAYMQGADQDLFVLRQNLDLNITDQARTVTITFDLLNTWFFEDFDANGLFNPGEGAEACSANSEWSPLLPEIEITVD